MACYCEITVPLRNVISFGLNRVTLGLFRATESIDTKPCLRVLLGQSVPGRVYLEVGCDACYYKITVSLRNVDSLG